MPHHPKGLATTPCFQYPCSPLLSALPRFTQVFTACLPPLRYLPSHLLQHNEKHGTRTTMHATRFRDQITSALTFITELSSLCVYSIYVARFFKISIKQNSNITFLFILVVVHPINPNPSSLHLQLAKVWTKHFFSVLFISFQRLSSLTNKVHYFTGDCR